MRKKRVNRNQELSWGELLILARNWTPPDLQETTKTTL